jgi:hypothetical protein
LRLRSRRRRPGTGAGPAVGRRSRAPSFSLSGAALGGFGDVD